MNGNKAPAVLKRVTPTINDCPLAGLKLVHQKVFPDERGFFSEAYNDVEWKSQLNFSETFLQSNLSYSKYGVLRGLHSQPGMGKLVAAITGEILDVVVDIRSWSTTFGQSYAVRLKAEEKAAFWIPSGFLHGFQTLSPEGAHVYYQCSAVYDASTEFGVNPFDPDLAIDWPIIDPNLLIVSSRDRNHSNLRDCRAINGVTL